MFLTCRTAWPMPSGPVRKPEMLRPGLNGSLAHSAPWNTSSRFPSGSEKVMRSCTRRSSASARVPRVTATPWRSSCPAKRSSVAASATSQPTNATPSPPSSLITSRCLRSSMRKASVPRLLSTSCIPRNFSPKPAQSSSDLARTPTYPRASIDMETSILQRNFSVFHHLSKLLQVPLEGCSEGLRVAGHDLIGGRLQAGAHIGCVQRLGGFALDQRHDLGRRFGWHEPALPARRFKSRQPAFCDGRHVRQRGRALAARDRKRAQPPGLDVGLGGRERYDGEMHLAGNQCGVERSVAAVGYGLQLDAGRV